MQAIILAAGMGKRLKEYTQNNTKCMVKVNGVTLIERMLRQIERVEVSQIVIVVGYKGQELIDYISTLDIQTPIAYVRNDIYNRTNNIYSLALAEKYLIEEDTLLFESDLIFEDSVLEALVSDERPTLALVDKYESWMDGTCVILSDEDVITRFVPGNGFRYEDADKYYKTVNIYKFSKEFSRKIYVPFLEAYLSAMGENEYYEQVLRILTVIDDPQIYAKRLSGEKWYEIDDVQDLDIAESLFVDSSKEYAENITSRYGGYWRYPYVIDFCYPQNAFFPPKRCLDEIMAMNGRLIKSYPSGQRIIRLLAAKDTLIEQSSVLITNGIEESIYVLLSAIPGKIGVVLPDNEYVLDVLKDRAELYLSDGETTYAIPDLIEYYSKKTVKAIYLSNPNYHTGVAHDDEETKRLMEWAASLGIYVIIDETYMDYCKTSTSLMNKENVNRYSNLIILKNLSVSYGVTGLRIGCVVSGSKSLLLQCQEKLPCWNIDSFAEFFLQIIGKYQRDFVDSIDGCIKERKYLEDEVCKIEGLSIIRSEACFIVFEVINGISAEFIVNSMLSNYSMLVKNASKRISASGRQYIKIAVRDHSDNVRFIEALKDIVSTEARITETIVDIDDTHSFFEGRIHKQFPHRYNYVIYQDSNPRFAIERDLFEKNKIAPLLYTGSDSYVLDVGCGVARWGDYFKDVLDAGKYVGIDFSESLLRIAEEQYAGDSRYVFARGMFQELERVIIENGLPDQYDNVLINGVLMYINDGEIENCLTKVKKVVKENGRVYIKESVGVNNRFTLNHYYSAEMNTDYSAIYRSIDQYHRLFNKEFIDSGFDTVSSGYTWDKELSNRDETTSYYWVFRRTRSGC